MSAATTSKIFIGSIPHCVTEEHLRNEVCQYGTVKELFYMQDQVQQSRGWAFVTFNTRDEAVKAINNIDSKLTFPGGERPVEARFANQKPNLNNSVFQNSRNPHKIAPSCWQQYFTPEGHPYYYNSVTMQTQWERPSEMDMPQTAGIAGGYRPLTQGGAIDRQQSGGTGRALSFGPPGSNLFIFHLPSDWNDIDLIQHFQHFGCILSARIQRDNEGRNRGFGFISFDNQTSAANAIRGLNGFCVSGKFLKVQLKKGEECCQQAAVPQSGVAMAGGNAGGSFLGIHAHNNPSIRYTPY